MRIKGRVAAVVIAALGTVTAFGTTTASAATEFGDNCAATGSAPNYTFLGLTAPGNPLPLTAPTSGVITSWHSNVALGVPVSLSMGLKVLRATGVPLQFKVVAEAAPVAITGNGRFGAATRIPVQAGDRLGLSDLYAPLYCQTESEGDTMGTAEGLGSPPVDSPLTMISMAGYRVPVAATIEPDADGDGYGDETQDDCPTSATVQVPCPPVKLDAFALVSRGAVVVRVTTDTNSTVAVSGTVKLGKGRKATLAAKRKTVTPGVIAKFTYAFPAKLAKHLRGLEPGKKLTLTIAASATNIAGQVSTDKLKVKLTGQG